MFKFPSPYPDNEADKRSQRILEVIPGTLTWATLIGMPLFSFFLPVWVSVFVILFDIYWIHRTIFISVYSVSAYRKLLRGKNTDWWGRCQNIKEPRQYSNLLGERINDLKKSLKEKNGMTFSQKMKVRKEIRLLKSECKEVVRLEPIKDYIWDWRKIIHVVMLPTAGEPASVIEPTIKAIKDSNFPNKQIIILLATEEREPEEKRLAKVNYLKEKFDGVFRDFLVTTHIVAEGEMKCKASNATFAARELKKYLEEKKINLKKVVFSNFDCDSVCHKEYFAALTYQYIIDPKRLQRSYQPIPMYHNNLWDTNAFVRVIVTSSSFWHMFQSTRKEMVTFSSHSEPFDTLAKVDFWPVNMISEDSIIYWKCFAYYNGDYQVTPIYLPISLDAVLAETYWQTIKNQYFQKRRWAYGIENFPIIMRSIWKNRVIKLSKKLNIAFEMLEGHHSWATAPFILAFLGWMPLIFGGSEFNESVLAHNLPFITRGLMSLAMLGLVISMSLSFLLLPSRPKGHSRWKYLNMLFQWALIPIIAPTLGALPAIDSQTRILIKKYFTEFWVTPKGK